MIRGDRALGEAVGAILPKMFSGPPPPSIRVIPDEKENANRSGWNLTDYQIAEGIVSRKRGRHVHR